MRKIVVFFSYFSCFFLFVKQDAKASVFQIVRDTSAIDTLETSSGESMINLYDAETYRELKIIELQSKAVFKVSLLILLLCIFTLFVGEHLLVTLMIAILFFYSIVTGLTMFDRAQSFRKILPKMSTSDINYKQISRVVKLSKWAGIAGIFPFILLFVVLSMFLPDQLGLSSKETFGIFSILLGLIYLIFEGFSFGTNRIFD
jgi:hypothetical protein